MKGNRGFSLVELIVVIAIMAILVGLSAPQLVRYVEKTNVSADTQLAESIRQAVVLAMSDPDVVRCESYVRPESSEFDICVNNAGSTFSECVYETLGVSDYTSLLGEFRSKGCSGVTLIVDEEDAKVAVQIEGSHADAKGGAEPIRVE